MTQVGRAAAIVAVALLSGCSREGVEPPALRVTRYSAAWPCAAGDSGRHDLTLNEVLASGEPTMYDLVITCAPGAPPDSVVVERGRWSVVQDTSDARGIPVVELHQGDGPVLVRYQRIGTDTLIPLGADGAPQAPVLSRVVEQP